MKLRILSAIAVTLLSVGLSSCTFLEPDRSVKGGVVRFGKGGVFDKDYDGALSAIDLPSELDPLNCGGRTDNMSEEEKLSRALRGFGHSAYSSADAIVQCTASGDASQADIIAKLRRNQIQDRIILASNQACDAYRRHLLATQSVANYLYGNATILTAGLGAMLKPPGTSQALSGAAAILGGSRAEYNDAFFRKLVAEVISRGILVERQTVLAYIESRQVDPIASYSIQRAMADAINYNSKCTLITGLENANKAQSFYADPGPKRLAELLAGDENAGLGDLLKVLTEKSAARPTAEEPTEPVAGADGQSEKPEKPVAPIEAPRRTLPE